MKNDFFKKKEKKKQSTFRCTHLAQSKLVNHTCQIWQPEQFVFFPPFRPPGTLKILPTLPFHLFPSETSLFLIFQFSFGIFYSPTSPMDLFSHINLLMLLLSRKDNDVFLSFSHHDIGKNFGDHLYKDLNSAGIRTLRDDGGIYAGQKSDIKKAIQASRISVVVFSKGYASSTKCLDQLVHIMDARNKTRLLVLPVFYNVDPSEVSEQKGLFEEAFAKHEKSFHKEMDRVESWRAALKEAADLAGMVLQQDRYISNWTIGLPFQIFAFHFFSG